MGLWIRQKIASVRFAKPSLQGKTCSSPRTAMVFHSGSPVWIAMIRQWKMASTANIMTKPMKISNQKKIPLGFAKGIFFVAILQFPFWWSCSPRNRISRDWFKFFLERYIIFFFKIFMGYFIILQGKRQIHLFL